MNLEIKDISPTRKSLVITLDSAEVDAEHSAVIGEFGQMAQLPGFRPGKAPAAMVKKRYAKEIAEEFKKKVVGKAYRDGQAEAKLEVMHVIDVEEGQIAPATAATITVTVDVRPQFTLPDYSGLTAEVTEVEPTDVEVDEGIENIRKQGAEYKPVTRPASKGDNVKLTYTGRLGDKPITELAPEQQIYGHVPFTWMAVEEESGYGIPVLSQLLGQQLAGLAVGDKRELTVSYPADFAQVPALAGQAATYAIEVLEVRELTLPPMDEAFFKLNQAENLDTLKTKMRLQLKYYRLTQNHQATHRQILDQLMQRAGEFPVPESLVEQETQSSLRSFIEQNMRQGVTEEVLEQNKQKIYAAVRENSTKGVRSRFLLAQIAVQEKLEVTVDDLNNYIRREARRAGMSEDKFARDLAKDRDHSGVAQQTIILDKALDLLASRATVTTVAPKAPA